jgi:hypothetical protein
MKASPRVIRRLVIASIFLAVFALLGYGTRQLTQAPPTCTDGIKNGNEEGVDCGQFACQNYCEPDLDPPQIVSTKLIKAEMDDYDFVAQILNEHKDFGASEVSYELSLINAEGKELLKREGLFYILPGQTKYLILPHLTTETTVADIKFDIKTAKWQKIDSLEGMNLVVRREDFMPGREANLDAVIFNDSDFDFDTVDIDVILRNPNGDIIAVNKSELNTVKARTERSFRATWPFQIPGSVDKIEIFPTTNLFLNSNFIKRYGSEVQKFQKYEIK